MPDRIVMLSEDGEELSFYVLEQTRVAQIDYLLVTETPEGDGDCYILKDVSEPSDAEALYEFVFDRNEQRYLSRIFEELLEDTEISE